MMTRFHAYLDKVFGFRAQMGRLVDSRREPVIPTAAVFGTAFAMFATCRGSLNGIDKERHFPGRLQRVVGPRIPSGDTVGRVYAQLDSGALREVLKDVHLRIKRNKMLSTSTGLLFVAVDGRRLLLQDADGLFSQRAPGQWCEGRRTVQYGDEEGFTSCEGVSEPLRVLHTLETVRLRERIAREWKESEATSSWYWATTFKQRQLSTREFYQAGHRRWDIENGCFNSTSAHWGLDHVFKHEPTAIVNFILTLFLAFVLLQCFWQRNLKSPFRDRFTLIGLAAELYLGLAGSPHARARAP